MLSVSNEITQGESSLSFHIASHTSAQSHAQLQTDGSLHSFSCLIRIQSLPIKCWVRLERGFQKRVSRCHCSISCCHSWVRSNMRCPWIWMFGMIVVVPSVRVSYACAIPTTTSSVTPLRIEKGMLPCLLPRWSHSMKMQSLCHYCARKIVLLPGFALTSSRLYLTS